MKALISLTLVVVSVLLASCGGQNKATITTRLISAKTTAVATRASVSRASVTYAAKSFTPTVLKVPITQINLLGTGSRVALYSCSAADCSVNLATDLSSFTELINSTASIPAGIYDRVEVMTCSGSATGYSPRLAGSVSLDGRAYRTSSTGVSTAAGSPEEASVSFQGCAREYRLPSQIAVTSGESVALNLYVDLQNIAWIADPAAGSVAGISYLPSGCSGTVSGGGVPSSAWVCMGYPDVAATVGANTPTLERYLVVEGSSGVSGTPSGAVFGLFFDAAGHPLSGYTRRFFDPSAAPNIGFLADTPISTFSDNGGGAYTLENYGEGSPGGLPGPASFRSTFFKRMNHTAPYTVPRTGSSGNYSAKLL